MAAKIVLLTLISFLMNLPFGYLRQGAKKFSLKWILYIHLPVPLIIALRILWVKCPWLPWVPLFIFAAVIGQLVGGKFRKSPA